MPGLAVTDYALHDEYVEHERQHSGSRAAKAESLL